MWFYVLFCCVLINNTQNYIEKHIAKLLIYRLSKRYVSTGEGVFLLHEKKTAYSISGNEAKTL